MDTLTTVRYIDANKLMSDLCLRSCYNREHRCDNDSAANEDLKVVEMIKEMPTIDAEPVRHGRWIAVPSSDVMTGKAYKCSECNKMRYGSFMPNYCQNCGAKMDGGAEE